MSEFSLILEAVLKSFKKFVKDNLGESDLKHRLGSIRQIFIVDGESSEVPEPGERPLHNPSFRQHLKFGRAFVRTENHLQRPPEFLFHPVTEIPLITSVGEYLDKTREPVRKSLYDLRRTLAVVKIGLMDSHRHGKSKCVNDYVFLAPLDPLVPVNPLAARSRVMRSLHASGVDDPHAGASLPARNLAGKGMQRCHYIFYDPFKFPLAEVVVHCLPRTESFREKPPLAPCPVYV